MLLACVDFCSMEPRVWLAGARVVHGLLLANTRVVSSPESSHASRGVVLLVLH